MTERRYLTAADVATRYNVKSSVVYEWVARGLIPYRKLPGRKQLLFDPIDLNVYDDGDVKLERRKLPGGGVLVQPAAVTKRVQNMSRQA
jgi:helix-turn-helix protein